MGRFFGRQSIAGWIVVIFICILLPVNILLISSTQNYMDALETQTVDSCKSIMEVYLSQLDIQTEMMDRYYYSMSTSDSDFIRVLQNKGDDFYIMSTHSVYRSMNDNLLLNSIQGMYFLLSETEATQLVAASGNLSVNVRDVRGYIQDVENQIENQRWKTVDISGRNYLLRSYRNNQIYYGSLIALDPFLQNMQNNLEFEYESVNFYDKNRELSEDTGRGESDRSYLRIDSDKNDIGLKIILNRDYIYNSLPLIKRMGYMFSFVCLLLIPILFVIFNRLLIRPMKTIDNALNRLEKGDQDYRISEEFHARELVHMGNSFNQMADQIYHLKIEAYEKELEKNKVKLKNIQLQVRPHFLLNIFHLIFSMAQIKNYEGVQKMTLYLSQYFRHLFSKGDVHTLAVELELVQGYIKVLQVQYPDCFEISYDIDEALLNVQLPTLLIHSLLENIAKYAISVGNFIDIRIRCYKDGDDACMEVADDGPGIEPEILAVIDSAAPVEKSDGRHIGLWNARKRLKMLCGENASLELKSRLSEGTIVTVRIPLVEAGEVE